MNGSKTTSVLSALIAGLLLSSVGLRVSEDAVLFRQAGADPFAAALLAVEAVLLGVVALLGIASAFIAWLTWRGRMRRRIPAVIVFGLVLLGGAFLAVRGNGLALAFGGTLVLLSGATLVSHFRFRGEPFRVGEE